jgi:hypothetical protein
MRHVGRLRRTVHTACAIARAGRPAAACGLRKASILTLRLPPSHARRARRCSHTLISRQRTPDGHGRPRLSSSPRSSGHARRQRRASAATVCRIAATQCSACTGPCHKEARPVKLPCPFALRAAAPVVAAGNSSRQRRPIARAATAAAGHLEPPRGWLVGWYWLSPQQAPLIELWACWGGLQWGSGASGLPSARRPWGGLLP